MNSSTPCNPNNNIDAWAWLESLPPLSQWKLHSISTTLLSSLRLIATTSTALHISLGTVGNTILWTSKPLKLPQVSPTSNSPPLSLQSLQALFLNIFHDFISYDPNSSYTTTIIHDDDHDDLDDDDEYYSFLFDNLHVTTNQEEAEESSSAALKEAFNFALISLSFIASIHKRGPLDLTRSLKDQISSPASRDASWKLMREMGSTLEEQWMRSFNLAITALEARLDALQANDNNNDDNNDDKDKSVIVNMLRTKCPSTLFSRAVSRSGMVKVKVYCPLTAMEVDSSSGSADDKLMFSLNHHHLEGVVQLNYNVAVREKWVDLLISVDNIRMNVVALVKEGKLDERGAEKHFPSRISLRFTPSPPSTDILSVSVSKSSSNPAQQIGHDRTIAGSLDPTSIPSLNVSASTTTTTTLKPWKFEESADGDTGTLSWFLHDSSGDGREVFAAKPSLLKRLFCPTGHGGRYSDINRPFTRQGGVVFARDEYGDKAVCWKVDKAGLGRRMRWEVRGSVGLTYWPNKHCTLYNDTRQAEFVDTFYLTLL